MVWGKTSSWSANASMSVQAKGIPFPIRLRGKSNKARVSEGLKPTMDTYMTAPRSTRIDPLRPKRLRIMASTATSTCRCMPLRASTWDDPLRTASSRSAEAAPASPSNRARPNRDGSGPSRSSRSPIWRNAHVRMAWNAPSCESGRKESARNNIPCPSKDPSRPSAAMRLPASGASERRPTTSR